MAANRNLKQVRIENSSPAAPLGMVGGGGGGGNLKGLRGLEAESEAAAAAAMALAPSKEGGRDEEQEVGFTIDIKSFLKPGEKSYTQRCRLFVGNLPTDITEEDFKRLFERYGEPSEVFINRDRGFGFIRLVRIRTGLWGCPVTLGLPRHPGAVSESERLRSLAPRHLPLLFGWYKKRQHLPLILFLLAASVGPSRPFFLLPPSCSPLRLVQARPLHSDWSSQLLAFRSPPQPMALKRVNFKEWTGLFRNAAARTS